MNSESTQLTRWTVSAEQTLKNWLLEKLPPSRVGEEQREEIEGDIRQHLAEEFAAASLPTVTQEDVQTALARMGDPLPPEVQELPKKAAQATHTFLPEGVKWQQLDHSQPGPVMRGTNTFFYMLWAFILPAVAFGWEYLTGDFAQLFGNPMPTVWHTLSVLTVPILGFKLVHQRRTGVPLNRFWCFLLGFTWAISLWYAILFIPLIPYAVVGIIFFGLGLLVLAPLLANIQFWRARRQVKKLQPLHWKFVRWGSLLALLVILALDVSAIWTKAAASYVADSPTPSPKTLTFLRWFGQERALRELAYSPNPGSNFLSPGHFLSSGIRMSPQEARSFYFTLTGKNLSDAPYPHRPTMINGVFGRRGRDGLNVRGGSEVAGRARGLSMRESRMDWHVEEAANLAWGEWTMVFSNTTPDAQEARCRIALPQDGAVTRLTLWVNGEPQEAAYAATPKVKAAYQAVAVEQQRDPVLITQTSPGGIYMQCFPVPAQGTMKVRVTFTAPIPLHGRVQMPKITEQNYAVDATTQFWAQGQKTLSLLGKYSVTSSQNQGFHLLAGEVAEDFLTTEEIALQLTQEPANRQPVWAADPFTNTQLLATPVPNEATKAALGSVAVVVDDSASLRGKSDQIRSFLTTSLPTTETAYFVASATPSISTGAGAASQLSFTGGVDNAKSLEAAIRWLSGKPNGVLLWLHGQQPIGKESNQGLEQVLERSNSHFTLVDCPLADGTNTLIGNFMRTKGIRTVGLRALGDFASVAVGNHLPAWTYTTTTDLPANAKAVSDTLCRWHALEQYRALETTNQEAAIALAAKYQVVTPLTGAVVLERASDYAMHGLKQADPKTAQTVPTIPEPSSTMLLLLSLMGFGLRRRR